MPGRPAATPTLARTVTSRPSISNSGPIAAVSRLATRIDAFMSGVSRRSTANSSPPRRAAMSVARRTDRRRSPTATSRASPAACPSLSLTSLKSSRSTNRTIGTRPARIARLEARGDDLGEQRAVGEPGQRVVRGLVVELLLELPELLERLLQLAVLERDRGVVGQRLEQLQVLGLERAEVVERVRDEERPDDRRLAEQRRDDRLAAFCAPGPRLGSLDRAAGRRAGPAAR